MYNFTPGMDEFPEFDEEPKESVVATRVVALGAALVISVALALTIFALCQD